MRIERFHAFATEALAKAPDVQTVDRWDRGEDHLYGWQITLTSGARIWAGLTAVAPPGEKSDQPETPVTGEAPAESPYPELYTNGKTTPRVAAHYLAAALTNSGNTEILRAEAYAEDAQNPGFGVIFHSTGRAHCLFHHTARPGQDKGTNAFSLQGEF
ncbi:hypothetical protein DWB77_05345 [Streptomyces hundungensis]|uniref:Uncharacterized protein n=1 Tax=Streptomyces hundungensis TaxID=1077946 RepID=A0A387HI21_9ACTN|nr:hypothetical protein [Streptomyces hundungensis]AYG83149.1 hypothetical protein DWB77_05345 [Streptomyces hundungensis]